MRQLTESIAKGIANAQLAGLLAPFRPELIPTPPGRVIERPAAIPAPKASFELAASGVSWPTVDAGIAWLMNEKILTPKQRAALMEKIGSAASEASELLISDLDQRLSHALSESLANVEGSLPWRDRVNEIMDVTAAQAEAISRTYTHRAFQAGLDDIMSSPYVADEFPYLEYAATGDSRTRPEHAAMDGKIAHRNSPLAAEMRRLHAEWNCRCTLIPTTREEALASGIDDDTGWEEDFARQESLTPVLA